MKKLTSPFSRYFALIALICGSALALGPTTATPRPDMEIIVHHNDDYVELFLSIPADDLTPLFGMKEGLFAKRDGAVDFASLRNGTYERAQVMFEGVTARLGARPVRFEAMSMMFHPKSERARFVTPLDAAVAVSVCNVDDPNRLVTMADLHSYAGFITFGDQLEGTLTLEFVNARDNVVELVSVRTFRGDKASNRTMRLEGGKLDVQL